MKRKVIYIAGLSRVGSTLLDFVLGNHPGFVGLGEVYEVLRPEWDHLQRDYTCSCGKALMECPFWGRVALELNGSGILDIEQRYRVIFNIFDHVFDRDLILVDSSKLLDGLKLLSGMPDLDLKVIYLVRDVRAWTISRLDDCRKRPETYGPDGYYVKNLISKYNWKIRPLRYLIPWFTRMPSYFFSLWYMQNRWFRDFIDHNDVNTFQLGYDELCLQPEAMLEKAGKFIGIDQEIKSSSFSGSKSHIIVGNIRKDDKSRKEAVRYDGRWMYRNEWLPVAFLFRNIMKYNAREVYKNIKTNSIFG